VRLNLARLRNQGRRLLALPRGHELDRFATKSWQISPPSEAYRPPAIFPNGELGRVRALSPWRNWDTERALAVGGLVHHDPTFRHRFRDATLFGSHLYAGGLKSLRGFGAESWALGGNATVPHVELGALCSSEFGSAFFGTYLQYDFPLALLCEGVGTPLRLRTLPMEHGDDYRHLAGLSPCAESDAVTVRELTVFTDYAENRGRSDRYIELRNRMRKSLGGHRATTPYGAYIRRGHSGELRVLQNEQQVEAILATRGFSIVDPTSMSAREISQTIHGASVVVAVEGSHISHCIFSMADSGTIVVLQPPARFSMCYKEFTDCVDMRYAFLVCEPDGARFSAPIDRLQELLDGI